MRHSIDYFLKNSGKEIRRILDRSLRGYDLNEEEVVALFSSTGNDFTALVAAADHARQEIVGNDVTYVVNRNINFTNVCVKRCSFCAFSRNHRSGEGYYLTDEEILQRAHEAWDVGATEICIQAGLPPDMEGDLYIRICNTIKSALPELHIHAFSPEEILYGSRRSSMGIQEYLRELKGAGIGSLPGTSAEILVQEVRDIISPGRITVAQWVEVIQTAHSLGIPTTSTIMYGHVENTRHLAQHLILLRDLQKETGGFTEFVPLSFIHHKAPMYKDGFIKDVRPGATESEVLKMHAVPRLVLNHHIPNIQVSWVKEGLSRSQACLAAGVNDMGGTLINESISTAAGATHGQLVRPQDLRRCIWDAGRIPVERSTLYDTLKRFEKEREEARDHLDELTDDQIQQFGSYDALTKGKNFRFSQVNPANNRT